MHDEAPQTGTELATERQWQTLPDHAERSEAMFRAIYEQGSGLAAIIDLSGRLRHANPAALELIGAEPAEVIGRLFWETPWWTHDPVEQARLRDAIERAGQGEYVLLETSHMAADGALRHIEFSLKPVRDEDGLVFCLIPEGRDITARKRAEAELRHDEARLTALLELAQMSGQSETALTDYALERAIEVTASSIGYLAFMDEDETVLTMYSWSKSAMRQCAIDDQPIVYPIETTGLWGEAVRQRRPVITNDYEADSPLKKGFPSGHVPIKRHMNIPLFDGGRIVLVAGVGNKLAPYDETDVKQLTLMMDGMWKIIKAGRVERALRDSEARYRFLVQSANDVIITLDASGSIEFVSPAIERIAGYRPDDLKGRDGFGRVHPDDRTALRALFHQLAGEAGATACVEYRYQHRDGHYLNFEANAVNLLHDPGVQSMLVTIRDVTERRHTEEQLRAALQRTQDIIECLPLATFVVDRQGTIVAWNQAIEEITGVKAEDMVGQHQDAIAIPFYGEERQILIDHIDLSAEELGRYYAGTLRREGTRILAEAFVPKLRGGAGAYIWGVAAPLFDSAGQRSGAIEVLHDVTEQRRAAAENARLQEQLQQAMKMEAVGRLAGGVAHDFNNLLTAIMGNLELAQLDLLEADPLYSLVSEVYSAAESAASLTQQLLAFSRRQVIEPRVLNPNSLVTNLQRMLARLIGEDIELVIRLEPEVGAVKVDPGQFDQVLVNLAVNARDAMLGGGKLVIETSNATLDSSYCAAHAGATPGEYVQLAVSDTGVGMTAEVKAHLFEPFFTTKETGRGTGLGLATTFGVVAQAGGWIDVYSEVGHGTTLRIWLPRVMAAVDEVRRAPTGRDLPRGTETVLLVEDEASVRDYAVATLRRLGYRVLPAGNGGEALLLLEQHQGQVQLLMTDVVMPGMDGHTLAIRLQQMQRSLKVLYTSGYTAEVIGHHGMVDEHLNFLSKPYTIRTLAAKLREVLD